MSTTTFRPTQADDMVMIEWALTEYATMIDGDDEVTDVERSAVDSLNEKLEGTMIPRSLTLTDVERDALRNALTAWHDNQCDDEGDGADHHDEIVQLDRLIVEVA